MSLSHLKTLRQRLAAGEAAYNGWLMVPDSMTAEAMTRAGWDSVTVDMQHGEVDYAALREIIPVIELAGSSTLVRVRANDDGLITRVLDIGAMGIICPMTQSAAEVEALVSNCRYPPHGRRSHGPLRASMRSGPSYTEAVTDGLFIMAMVETRGAIENLDAMLAVDGLTGIYVGPSDLSLALGGTPGLDRLDDAFVEVLKTVAGKARARGLIAGLHTGGPAYVRKAKEWGFNFFTTTTDIKLVTSGAKAQLDELRGAQTVHPSGPAQAY